jgi:tRNA pseudouridine38-40 synthase
VRSIIGTLVDIGRGKLAGPLSAIIDARDRKAAGPTAPAWGLVLEHISYHEV